jgi:hypothetical protein
MLFKSIISKAGIAGSVISEELVLAGVKVANSGVTGKIDKSVQDSKSISTTENQQIVGFGELLVEDYGLRALSACLNRSNDKRLLPGSLLLLESCDSDDLLLLKNSYNGAGIIELEKKNAKWYLSRYRRQDETAFLKLLEKIGSGQRK